MSNIRTKKKARPGPIGRGLLGALAGGVLLTTGIAIGASNSSVLYLNGHVASTDMRTIGGSAFVRLSDVAKSLGMNTVKRADGSTELTKEGGANAVGTTLQGKVGDTLFDGRWRLTVLSVETASTYTMTSRGEPYDAGAAVTYDMGKRVLTPHPGNTLMIVRCRVFNGQKTSQTLWIPNEGSNTALADDTGESYPPEYHDVDGAPSQTKSLLPGSKIDIPIIFGVPEGRHITSFVFTLRNNDSKKGTDVRVLLTPQGKWNPAQNRGT